MSTNPTCICVFDATQVKKGHRVELTTELKGTKIHVKDETEDMYTTIDAVAGRLVSAALYILAAFCFCILLKNNVCFFYRLAS